MPDSKTVRTISVQLFPGLRRNTDLVCKQSRRAVDSCLQGCVRNSPKAGEGVRSAGASGLCYNCIVIDLSMRNIGDRNGRSRLHESGPEEALRITIIRHHMQPSRDRTSRFSPTKDTR